MRQKSIRKTKVCPLCSRPHRMKTHLCMVCNKNSIEFCKKHPERFKHKKISISLLIELKNRSNGENIWDLLEKDINIINTTKSKKELKEQKRILRMNFDSEEYKNNPFKNGVPEYILTIFKKRPELTLLDCKGTYANPIVFFHCSFCNKDHAQHVKDLIGRKNHNCEKIKSSGELIVEQFLTLKNIAYKTQRETLKCINPITRRVLPYDFELNDKKVIIEVHGDQHYKFTEIFHGTIENFEYQLWKDELKKNFAIKKGYVFVELDYKKLKNGQYKKEIMQYII